MASPQQLAVPTEDGPIHVVHEGDGPHVVLLHPGGLDLTVWEDLSRQLAKTHHVVAHTTAQLTEKEVRNVRCVRLRGTGHLAMIEAPEVTLAEITAHLTQCRPDSAEETCVREPLIR